MHQHDGCTTVSNVFSDAHYCLDLLKRSQLELMRKARLPLHRYHLPATSKVTLYSALQPVQEQYSLEYESPNFTAHAA